VSGAFLANALRTESQVSFVEVFEQAAVVQVEINSAFGESVGPIHVTGKQTRFPVGKSELLGI